MINMESRIIANKEEKEKIEILRQEVFHIDGEVTFYLNELLNDKVYALVAYDEDKMIGGCYFHRFNNILMIDQVFVKEEYQNTGLRIGRELIKRLLNSKKELEELLGGQIDTCRIESQNTKAHSLYSKIGFHESNFDEDTMYKKL